MADTYSVLLTAIPLPPINDIAKPFARFRKLLVPDALHIIKPKWGLLEENLSEDQAKQLCALLQEAGISYAMVPSSATANVWPAHVISAVRFEKSGLCISADKQAWLTVPWAAFVLTAAAVLRERIVHSKKTVEGPSMQEKLVKTGLMLATGIPLPMSRKKTMESKSEEINLHFYLDIFLRKPALRLRLDGRHLDYHFLNEKMVMSQQENFRTMLKNMVECTPRALRNGNAIEMTKPKDAKLSYHESESDFDHECRWLMTYLNTKNALGPSQ